MLIIKNRHALEKNMYEAISESDHYFKNTFSLVKLFSLILSLITEK